MPNYVTQAVVTSQATLNPHQDKILLALFNADGTPNNGSDSTHDPITVSGAIGTVGKTTTAAEPVANSVVFLKFTSGNTAASPTVAFAGGAARAIVLGGSAVAAIECTLAANGIGMFFFDGTVLHQIGVYS